MNNKETFRINKPGIYNFEVSVDKKGQEKELLGFVEANEEGDYEINLLSAHKVGNSIWKPIVFCFLRAKTIFILDIKFLEYQKPSILYLRRISRRITKSIFDKNFHFVSNYGLKLRYV